MDKKESLYRKGLYLEYITVFYNMIEAGFAIGFGAAASSIALVAFGLDSIVESLSGFILIWRLKKHGTISEEEEERIEKKAIRFVAVTFFILAGYVLFESVKKLIVREFPDASLPGIIIACVSLVVMPLLAIQKYKTGKQIQSRALVADSKETIACFFLSAALLLGLGTHYLFGLWYADPAAGLIIVIFLLKEGAESWKEAGEEKPEIEEEEQ